MKAFVITIEDNERSVQAAERCINSGKKHGTHVEKFPAITPRNTDLIKHTRKHNINNPGFDEIWSRTSNCLAAFCSHHALWCKSIELNEDVLILEHDAVFIDKVPNLAGYQGCISLGHPSYGKYHTPRYMGVNELTSKQYFPGAHAYVISPNAAKVVLKKVSFEACPTDIFFHKDRFRFLQEYYPWPIRADDSFTTIQNEKGCKAKHNFGPGYDIL